jgi:diguanylate cyclase (GGDEF)-like protein
MALAHGVDHADRPGAISHRLHFSMLLATELRQLWPAPRTRRHARARATAGVAFALAILALVSPAAIAAIEIEVGRRAMEIEAYLPGHPKRALAEIPALLVQADAPPSVRRQLLAMQGQAMVLSGRIAEALAFADRHEAEARAGTDPRGLAIALLVRSAVQSSIGDAGTANALARQAENLLQGTDDAFLTHWALMAAGTTARARGRRDESMASLHEALALAERVDNAYRRSSALYQLSVLHLDLKQGDRALASALDAWKFAETAGSAYAMANARMAESAALELLERPERELAAMQEALAIAQKSQSSIAESRALVNLSDIQLRRHRFKEALDLARKSLDLAVLLEDRGLASTSKANMGFALFGLNRVSEGKRLTDEALAGYERTGATSEIAGLLGEYGQYLERAGDHKAALALFHRERKLNDEIALAAHERTVLELQEKYESDKRQREIELLNRENDVKTAELRAGTLQQRGWWLLAGLFGFSFVVVATLYRKLRATNRLLGDRNRELSFQSSRDPLTALYNRRYFQDYIGDAGARNERNERRRTDGKTIEALLLIDLDHFKEINDRFGHAAGDAILVAVAQRLRDTLRETDMIVRWGGEEFLVFIAATHADRLDEIALRIMHAIAAEPFLYHGVSISATASIGFVPMPLPPRKDPLPWERAIGIADMALYLAKLHGRNRGYGVSELVDGENETLAGVERDLEAALRDGLVDVHVLSGADTPLPPPTETAPAIAATRH